MIYTAVEGVDRQNKEKILTAQLIILPLVMLAVTVYGLGSNDGNNGQGGSEKSPGVTLGTNTDSSPGTSGPTSTTTTSSTVDTTSAPADSSTSQDSSSTGTTRSNSSFPKASGSSSASTGGGQGSGGSGSGSCPCRTIADVLNTLAPTLPLPISPPPTPLQSL